MYLFGISIYERRENIISVVVEVVVISNMEVINTHTHIQLK